MTAAARLVPVAATCPLAGVYGALRGQVHFHDDFNDLPGDVADAFGAVTLSVSG